MVSFSCENCNETFVKKKVLPHLNRCHAPVTCIDCSKTFPGQSFKEHNQCITETEKYQKHIYQPKPEIQSSGKGKNTDKKDQDSTKDSTKDSKKKSKAKEEFKPIDLKIKKKTSLKKLLKQARKSSKLSKKEALARVYITEQGTLELKM